MTTKGIGQSFGDILDSNLKRRGKHQVRCDNCGEYVPEDDLKKFDGEWRCPACRGGVDA